MKRFTEECTERWMNRKRKEWKSIVKEARNHRSQVPCIWLSLYSNYKKSLKRPNLNFYSEQCYSKEQPIQEQEASSRTDYQHKTNYQSIPLSYTEDERKKT